MLTPVELMLESGEKATLQVKGYNKNGQFVQVMKDATITADGGGRLSKDGVVYRSGDRHCRCCPDSEVR
jgi:hypothetical protein